MKRNKAAVRRQRHAKRLHELIESFRVVWPATHKPPRPSDNWRFNAGKLQDLTIVVLSPRTGAYDARTRVVPAYSPVGRVYNMALTVEVLPIALSLAARGRRVDQIGSEYAEVRSRVKHGDVI